MVFFNEVGISKILLQELGKLGVTSPTAIQRKSIKLILSGKSDFVGEAPTGSGKTLAYVLSVLTLIDLKSRGVQVLILVPTRELAAQVEEVVKPLINKVTCKLLKITGGENFQDQIKSLKSSLPQVVIGTPGRISDLITKNKIILDKTPLLVLDEADEMFKMGLSEDVLFILNNFPPSRRVLLFSATLNTRLKSFINKYFNYPQFLKIEKDDHSSKVKHCFRVISNNDLDKRIIETILDDSTFYGIIFCKTKKTTTELSLKLRESGISCNYLNSDLEQEKRTQILSDFRFGKIKLLIATDIAARGLDIEKVKYILHYDLPKNSDVYIHRCGRAGRGDEEGKSILFVRPEELKRLAIYEKAIGIKIKRIKFKKN